MEKKRKENCDGSIMICLKRYARLSLIFLLISTISIVTVCANKAPTVTNNQAAGQVDPTKSGPINIRVIFSENVTSFTASNVTLGGTAGAGKTVTGNRIGFGQIASIDRDMR